MKRNRRDPNGGRKVWLEHYLSIPDGWHIHHIDGDRFNNNLSNLECLPPKRHGERHAEMENAIDPRREKRKAAMRNRLARQIEFWQLRCKMDVARLAKTTGLAEISIYRLKRCERGASIDTITILADAFQIPPGMLLMPLENN